MNWFKHAKEMGMAMEKGLKGWWTISEEVKSRKALGKKEVKKHWPCHGMCEKENMIEKI